MKHAAVSLGSRYLKGDQDGIWVDNLHRLLRHANGSWNCVGVKLQVKD